MTFSQQLANFINAACAAWIALVASGMLGDPAPKWAHWVNIAVVFLMALMVNLGFKRLPNGNPLPTAMLEPKTDSTDEQPTK